MPSAKKLEDAVRLIWEVSSDLRSEFELAENHNTKVDLAVLLAYCEGACNVLERTQSLLSECIDKYEL